MYHAEFQAPIGPLHLYGTAQALLAIVLPKHSRLVAEAWVRRVAGQATIVDDAEAHEETVGQLGDYFAGRRKAFDLPLDLRGTAFQRSVWEAVGAVPYGQTRSYSDIAQRVGRASAVRAVGAANGANPIPIVIPCHRIIGSNGSLTGYGGGLEMKRRLLDMERGTICSGGRREAFH